MEQVHGTGRSKELPEAMTQSVEKEPQVWTESVEGQTENWAPGAATTVSCLPCSSRRTRSAEFSSTFFLAAASSSLDHCM